MPLRGVPNSVQSVRLLPNEMCIRDRCWTVAGAKDDVIDILSGDWHGDDDDQRNEDASGYADTVGAGLERWQR